MGGFRAIFFDNDGILVDTEPVFVQALEATFQEFGLKGNPKELSQQNAARGGGVWQKFWTESGQPESRALFTDRLHEIYCDFLQINVPRIKGVEDALQLLHKRIPMSIVTASLREPFDTMHKQTGFLRFFDFWITRDGYTHSKPHPDPYNTAFLRMKQKLPDLKPSECLVLEDSERGVVSAKEAGMTCFAIPTEFTKTLDFSRADKVLKDVQEVLQFLHKI